jgi:hypothetical protein
LLAGEPRFTWDIVHEEPITCVLCKVLLEVALPTLRESSQLESRRLSVGIRLTDEMGLGDKAMVSVSRIFVSMITGQSNSWSQICAHEAHRQHERCRVTASLRWNGQMNKRIRYYICPSSGTSRNHSIVFLRCCIRRHEVQPKVIFNLVAGWLSTCDKAHQDCSNPWVGEQTLDDLRFIDVQRRCVIKRSHRVRYTAQS